MNSYGLTAMQVWQRHAPARVAAMSDPTSYFTDLGEQIAQEVSEIATALETDLPTTLTYLERVGQTATIQKQAEEAVMADLVYGPLQIDPTGEDLAEQLEMILGQLPTAAMIEDQIQRIQQQAEDQADQDGLPRPILTSHQSEQLAALQDLLPLVTGDPGRMSPSALRTRIAALNPHLPQP